MSAPEPVTPPQRDTGRRAQSIYDLEETLVGFLSRLVDSYRFDNPTLNLSQATAPEPLEPRIVRDPDEPPVSYDPTERAQTLALKVPPRVERGRIPRTVTGEIAVDKLSDHPSITVQAIAARVELVDSYNRKIVTVRVCVNIYDENPDSRGYEDVQNLLEAIDIAFTSFGQKGIDDAYPIVMPIDWKLFEEDTFPHFIGELTAQFMLPAARPLPDIDPWTFAPGESPEFKVHYHREPEPTE
jgi:hypothetical protein